MIRHHESVIAALQARVAEGQMAGAYGEADLLAAFHMPSMAVARTAPEGPAEPAAPRLRPEVGYSSKPLVGPLITAAKRTAERLLHHVVQDGFDQIAVRMAGQTEALQRAATSSEIRDAEIIRAMRTLMAEEARRRRELEERVASLSAPLGADAPAPPPGRIQQVLAAAVPHDAVTDQALALDELLTGWGHDSAIYAEHIDPALEHRVGRIPMRPVDPDAVLLRYSIWSQAVADLLAFPPPRLGLIFHNVTPPQFFNGINTEVGALCAEGRSRVGELAGVADVVVTDSAYDAEDLARAGFGEVTVIPMLLDLRLAPAREGTAVGPPTILSVGRLAPNKRIEVLIASFALYQRLYAHDARLMLVGSPAGFEPYQEALERFVQRIGVRNVHFLGRIDSAERDRLYRETTVYGCTSSHEGFCAPLAEAMAAGLPVVALDSAAVPETLGGAGLVLPDADPRLIAEGLREVAESQELREAIRDGARERLADFAPEAVGAALREAVTTLLGGSDPRGSVERGRQPEEREQARGVQE